MFVELASEDALREWLSKLVGIERAVELRLPGAEQGSLGVVRSVPESAHEEALTREEVTSCVHYVRFALDRRQVESFALGPVVLAVNHPAYDDQTLLSEQTRLELLSDLRP